MLVMRKIAPFVENIAESTTACLVMMVQGNLLVLTLGHWLIASQTGVVAGAVTSAAILVFRATKRWIIAVVLGVVTAIVDFFVHSGDVGSFVLDAVLTGLGAALLSYLVGMALRYARARRPVRE